MSIPFHFSKSITHLFKSARTANLGCFSTDPFRVSDNFQALHAALAGSPWRFSAIVANSFGSPVVPPGLYSTLKLALLLSLVQTKVDDSDAHNHLDVLALTGNTLNVERYLPLEIVR